MPTFCFPNFICTSFPQATQRIVLVDAYGAKAFYNYRVNEFSPFSFSDKYRNHTLSAPYILQFVTIPLKEMSQFRTSLL